MSIREQFCFGVAILSCLACSQQPAGEGKLPRLQRSMSDRLYITATDFQVGLLFGVNLTEGRLVSEGTAIHSDAIVRLFEGDEHCYVVNRLGGDNIQAVSRKTGLTQFQQTVGRGFNPQDVLSLGDGTVLVTGLRSKSVIRMRMSDGNILEKISLESLADGDGYPHRVERP